MKTKLIFVAGGLFVLLMSNVCEAVEYASLDASLGSPDVCAVTGNGGLTVGVNAYGRLSACHWPSPSYYNQLDYRTGAPGLPGLGVAQECGAMWAVRHDGETRWLTGAPWISRQRDGDAAAPIVETTLQWPEGGWEAVQTTFVQPDLDLLVMRVVLRGGTGEPELFWYGNFAPCTRLVPELPLADWAFDGLNDFAAFADETMQTLYQFRPRQPGTATWVQAERSAAAGTLAQEAAALGHGTWIGYRCGGDWTGYQCGGVGGPSSAYVQAGAGSLGGEMACVGQCNGALELALEREGDSYVGTVYVAFGASRGVVDAMLWYAVRTGYSGLLDHTRRFWEGRLSSVRLPETDDAVVQALCRRCLAVLMQAMDRDSGAMVRCPVTQPPWALDWPRHGFWMTLALDLAGQRDLAERHTLFYRDTIRVKAERGKPLGSFPAACYGNGVEGVPHLVLETDATAWLLASFWRHAALLDAAERNAYLADLWEVVEKGAGFLVSWADSRTGAPLPSFRSEICRDAQPVQLLLDTYMGVDSALSIAEALGRIPPAEWRERKSQLEALVKFDFINGQWRLQEPIPFGLAEIAAGLRPVPREVEDRWIETLPGLQGNAAARALCDIALAWRGKPEKLERLRPLVRDTLEHALRGEGDGGPVETDAPIFPDALTASLAYIAAMIAYGATL